MPLDITKPMQTRCGYKVRNVVRINENNWAPCKLAGIVVFDDGSEYTETWTLEGHCSPSFFQLSATDRRLDLINVPEKRELWMNVYDDKIVTRETRESADFYADTDRLARLHITYTVGQFDE